MMKKNEKKEMPKVEIQDELEEGSVYEESEKHEEKIPDPYIDSSVTIKHGMFGKWVYDKRSDSYDFQYIGAAVYLEKIVIYAETMNRELQLYFYDAKGERVNFTIPREKMTEQYISEFTRKGVQVQKKHMPILLSSIFNQEKSATVETRHLGLGFGEYGGKKIFFGAKGIGISSVYAGKYAVLPQGNFEVWKKMIKDEVLGTDLEIIIAIAASAPLVDFFAENVHTGNPLISLVGESSTGKTTAGCLAVSLGAKCNLNEGMMLTFADSKNAIMNSIPSSYPVVIDEGSLIRFNPTSLLYELAEGREKGRLTRELVRAESNIFHTAIFMTTEKSILGMCDQNTGLYVRCFEFENVIWTKSADSSDTIKEVCENNYGFVIPNIAAMLLNIERRDKINDVLELYYNLQKKYVAHMKQAGAYTPLTERICKVVAMVSLGADFFSRATGIRLDSWKIGCRILELTAASDVEKLDIGQRALDYVCQYVTANFANFVKGAPAQIESASLAEGERPAIPINCKGRIVTFASKIIANGKQVSAEVFLTEMVFDEILYKGGFQDKKIVLKKWKESGILHCQSDRFISSFEIVCKQKVKGYRIFLPADSLVSEKSGRILKEEAAWQKVKEEDTPFVQTKQRSEDKMGYRYYNEDKMEALDQEEQFD